MDNKNETYKGIKSLGSLVPAQLVEESAHAHNKLKSALGNDVTGYVANRLQMSPEELAIALAVEQVDGVAFALYNIEARGQSVIIGDQTGIGKGRQAAAIIRYGMLAGYLPIFLTDRYTLFSDMYRDCKALGIKDGRPLILNLGASIVDFDKPVETKNTPEKDEIWSPDGDDVEEELMGIFAQNYEEVYKAPKKSELELLYQKGDIPEGRYEYLMLSYSQLKDARRDSTRLDFLSSLCERHRVLFIFDEAHKSSSVSSGKSSIITQGINSILEISPNTQCVFLSATFAKRPECLITFMRQTVLSTLATHETLKKAFSNGGIQMQEYVASILAKEGQMIRREHSSDDIPEPVYTYLDEQVELHSELFDKVMYWFRELVNLSEMVKRFISTAAMLGVNVFRPYPTRAQLFYVNKILLLALKAKDVAETAVKEVRLGRNVVIGMSDTLECVLQDSIDSNTGECRKGDFSTILLRLLDKTLSNPQNPSKTIFDLDLADIECPDELIVMLNEIQTYAEQIRSDISEDIFHLPMSPIDVIRQLVTQETYTDNNGVVRNIRFEECTGRVRQLEYLSPEGDDEYVNCSISSRTKRHSNLIYNDFQNNKLDIILVNACGAIGASAHAVATNEVPESEVRQRKMLIVQNDLDVNIDLQKRGRINRTGQIVNLPPLYEYIITSIPSEKRLNMMLRAKLRSLSANTSANQDQDKKQADFTDVTNKYGNIVTQEYLSEHPELAFVLGLNKSATATQLLARIAMLSVTAQQEIIEDIFGAYQNLEQELRRVNQWDLEREFRDFEAEFVREELFTASIDDNAFGGASMLSTFRCRHRTYPYDSKTLQQQIDRSAASYGADLSKSEDLKKEIDNYYRSERKILKNKIQSRREKLFIVTLNVLIRFGVEEDVARQIISLAQSEENHGHEIHTLIKDHHSSKRIKRKLKSYHTDFEDLEMREKSELKVLSEQRKRLMEIISKSTIGQGYYNIMAYLPVEEDVDRVIAVLKEVRFDKNSKKRFLPGKVQFVFALSAVHKELVLNLVNKGSNNNYDRLKGILSSSLWNFSHGMWDSEIARYNNRILERKIITGNILGAFANPLMQKMKPHFVTFTLSPDKEGSKKTERGLLLPMTGENVEKLMECVALPLGDGLKYATSVNYVYQVSGIGVDFTIIPSLNGSEKSLRFFINVNDKDSLSFESDERFDSIREYFKVSLISSLHNKKKTVKQPLRHFSTDRLSGESEIFLGIMNLLASLRAVILIPREYMTVGEMKDYSRKDDTQSNKHWPTLDWQQSSMLLPTRPQMKLRISAPVAKDMNIQYVDEIPPEIILCQRTLSYQGRSFKENTVPGQLRALYFEWQELSYKTPHDNSGFYWGGLAYKIYDNIHRMLVASTK